MPPQNSPVKKEEQVPHVRSAEQNSWGALIAIVVIMAVVVVGAFYAWGKRVSENRGTPSPAAADAAATTTAY